jgi:hypothetical protein
MQQVAIYLGEMKMNDIQSGSKDLLDTTDCLEAVGVFKGWKNFFFIIMVLCLLLLQASFWVVDRGCIGSASADEADTQDVTSDVTEQEATPVEQPAGMETVDPNIRQAEPPKAVEPNQPVEPEPEDQNQTEPNDVSGFSSFDSRIQRAVAWPSGSFLAGITFEKIAWLIRFVNAVLILSATLYCLTLLFSLKVSMHGRLGGINHISRAFFLSLILLALLLPWQSLFGGFVIGAIYSPAELAQGCSKEAGGLFDLVFYYLRFSGFGVLIFLLLIFSQIRSVRWAKAILRRLEII